MEESCVHIKQDVSYNLNPKYTYEDECCYCFDNSVKIIF